MANISFKIDLRQLVHSITTTPKGNKVIVIPIELNHLFEGKNSLYLDLQAYEFENKKADSKDTHIIKQSLPKDVFAKMTDEQKRAMPILGNGIYWGNTDSTPKGTEVKTEQCFVTNPDGTPVTTEQGDPMPF